MAGMRQSDRISLTVLLEASGRDAEGKEFSESARTKLIGRTGGLIVLDRKLAPEQQITLQRKAPDEAHRKGSVRIVEQIGWEEDGFLYGMEFADPGMDLWGVEFPPVSESGEAVARMLLECSYCRSREVVYLNDLELRGYETSHAIARHCKHCGVPSIWTQPPHESLKKTSAPEAESGVAVTPAYERRREKRRLQIRLTACVRQPGTDDELAVCENISARGCCFRSRRRYPAGARVEISIPFARDKANIFVAARVVNSEELPAAGLFRHGAEYLKPGAWQG